MGSPGLFHVRPVAGDSMCRVPALVMMASLLGCASPRAPASAPGQPPSPAATPAGASNLYTRIPAQIGAFKLTERTAVRVAPNDSLFRYSDGSRTILSVFVYDVADDVKSDPDPQKWTAREGEKFRVVQDIRRSRGSIGSYAVAFSDTTRFHAGAGQVLEHSIATPIRFPNGDIAVDMQFLYLIDGKFLKVRATIPGAGWEQTRVPSFARELAIRMARVP
jgi:hypothetical protein